MERRVELTITMRRRESSITSSNILLLLLVSLFISEIQARKPRPECSPSCGDLKNISYPLSLQGDPKECGVPELELSCPSNKAILQYGSGKYYVEEITNFYQGKKIRVVDVNLASGNCGLPTHGLSVTETIHDNRTGKTFRIRVLSTTLFAKAVFLKCSSNFNYPAYVRVPCLSGNQSQVYLKYIGEPYLNYFGESFYDPPNSCSLISTVPILAAIESYPPYEKIKELLKTGFYLELYYEDLSSFKDIFVGYLLSSLTYMPYLLNNLLWFALGERRYESEYGYYIDVICYYLFMCLQLVVLIVRFILAPIVLLIYIIHKYRASRKTVDKVEKFLRNQQSWMPKRYSYYEMIAMTNHFRDKLGQGGFGSVYKGQLHDGCLIAVKVLENSKFSVEEFINEVSTMGRIHHVNIAQLIGFCSEGSKRALVYEYMSNGSLDRYIFSKRGKGQSFNWKKLYEIALGTARGIEYLHGGCDVCILHFDIKPHNILLDNNYIPKVSDFGLAKFYPKENDFLAVSAIRGTIGYIAPELISRNFGVVSCKSDVYSFGMLLLEMAGARRNSFLMETRSSKAYFPSWVYDQIQKGTDLELQDVTENEMGIARKLCIIGLWCIQVNAADRPSITKVREMLEGSNDGLQIPPKPCFSSSPHVSTREIESNSSTELLLTESMEECL